MSPRLVTYASWNEVYGEWPSEKEVKAFVGKFNKLSALILLARINVMLSVDRFRGEPNDTINLQTFFARNFLSEQLRTDLMRKYGSERMDARVVFHPQQVVTAMKWAITEAQEIGGLFPDVDEEARNELGRCLIMVSDIMSSESSKAQFVTRRKSRSKKALALQLVTGAGNEIGNPPNVPKSIVRSEIMFGDLAKVIRKPIDIHEAYFKATGLSLDAYTDFIFGIAIHYLARNVFDFNDDPGLNLVNTRLLFASADQADTEKFWKLEVESVSKLAGELDKPSGLRPQHDFLVFRRRPFFRTEGDSVAPTQLSFVLEKLESGLFWAIFNSLATPAEKDSLFIAWGYLVEAYVNRLLAGSAKSDEEMFLPGPLFQDNAEESFDGVLIRDSQLCVFECKGGFLKAEAKYAEDLEKFTADLDLKFGAGPGAGMEQLARKIGQVFAEDDRQRRCVVGLDASKITTVIPILIVQDGFVSSELTSLYLSEQFSSLMRKRTTSRRVHCQPALVLDVSDVETLRSFSASERFSLSRCILARSKGGAAVLSMRDFLREYGAEQGFGPATYDKERKIFEAVMNRVSMRFFQKPFVPEPPGVT